MAMPRLHEDEDEDEDVAPVAGFREVRAWAHPGIAGDLPGPRQPVTGGRIAATEESSGSVNRWLRPDSVRHMSVTTAMQGLTAAHHDTQRDKRKKAREPGYAQATGRFRRWWQVLGSNQRRLSRRFYRPASFTAFQAADLGVHDFGALVPRRRSVQVPRQSLQHVRQIRSLNEHALDAA